MLFNNDNDNRPAVSKASWSETRKLISCEGSFIGQSGEGIKSNSLSPSTFGHSWDSHPPPDSHLILIWIFNLENWICLYFSSRICKYIQRFFCHSAKTQAQGRMVSLNQENAASDLNLDMVLPYFLPLFTLKGFVCSISFMGFKLKYEELVKYDRWIELFSFRRRSKNWNRWIILEKEPILRDNELFFRRR